MFRYTKDRDVLFVLKAGDPFYKKLRWKDKFKNPINLTGYVFKARFIYNFGEDNVLADLTIENEGITVTNTEGEIKLYIPSTITSNLKAYDQGLWKIEYLPTGDNEFRTLVEGRWSAKPDILL